MVKRSVTKARTKATDENSAFLKDIHAMVVEMDADPKLNKSGDWNYSVETRKWTCEIYQATGLSFQTAFERWIDWSSMLNNAYS